MNEDPEIVSYKNTAHIWPHILPLTNKEITDLGPPVPPQLHVPPHTVSVIFIVCDVNVKTMETFITTHLCYVSHLSLQNL